MGAGFIRVGCGALLRRVPGWGRGCAVAPTGGHRSRTARRHRSGPPRSAGAERLRKISGEEAVPKQRARPTAPITNARGQRRGSTPATAAQRSMLAASMVAGHIRGRRGLSRAAGTRTCCDDGRGTARSLSLAGSAAVCVFYLIASQDCNFGGAKTRLQIRERMVWEAFGCLPKQDGS